MNIDVIIYIHIHMETVFFFVFYAPILYFKWFRLKKIQNQFTLGPLVETGNFTASFFD